MSRILLRIALACICLALVALAHPQPAKMARTLAEPASLPARKLSWIEKRDAGRAKRQAEINENRGGLTNAERLQQGLSPTKPQSLWTPSKGES